jgi:site-specific DNA recombinase
MKRTVAYVRVSTEDQASNGISLEAQKARVEAYALAMNLTIDEVIIDAGQSAKTLDRPGMSRILDGIRSRVIGTLIALKLDRVTRSTRDLADLLELFQRADAALISVSESLDTKSASGRLVVNMLGVVSQWEREVIGERTATALAHKRSTGRVYGSTPFGYARVDDQLITVPEEQAAIAAMRQLHDSGRSFRDIALTVNTRGIRPHRSASWQWSSVRAVLRSRIATEAFESIGAASP